MERVSVLYLVTLLTIAAAGPISDKQHKTVRKRNVADMDLDVGGYRTDEDMPGMVDDEVAAAFLKDAAAEEARERHRSREISVQRGGSEEGEEQDEMPLSLPMARLAEAGVMYGEPKPEPHRSKALSEVVYPADDDTYIPYYPSPEIYFRRRRRRSRPAKHSFSERSGITPVRELLKEGHVSSSRKKRQIRLSDSDLGALIAFLTDLKLSIERSSKDCNNPAHHSFFRENQLNEELGAGSGIDDDYTEEDQPPSQEQEYPVWLMPHSYPSMPSPQRRSLYYPALVPGQKRASPPLGGAGDRYRPSIQTLQNKLLAWERSRGLEVPSARYFQ